MGVAVSVSPLVHLASDMRSLARSETGPVACRILAIAYVFDRA